MSSADDAWADLLAADAWERSKVAARGGVGFVSEAACGAGQDKPKKAKKKSTAKKKAKPKTIEFAVPPEPTPPPPPPSATTTTDLVVGSQATATVPVPGVDELVQRVQRPIMKSTDPDLKVRRAALKEIQALVETWELDQGSLRELFGELAKPLFKRFEDPSEQCRELALRLSTRLLGEVHDVTPHLPYFFPALLRRMSSDHRFDPELQIFVFDHEANEAFKRGRATSRQDKTELEGATHRVVEPSEELRLLLVKMLAALVEAVLGRGASTLLHPYFHDVVLFFQAQLRDPYPEVKVEACRVLTALCRAPELNQGFIFYATALSRAGLPLLRHRHGKVRLAAVAFVRAAIAVPHKAKWRAAGSEAIVDLVGFQAENNIPIAAFYQGYTSVNYLAELTVDPVVAVRIATAHMLAEFLTEIMDRYDHKTRLVAYALNAVNDPAKEVSAIAMDALAKCGREYEKENQDEIIERRQYGVDGDRRANHGPLPPPFLDRPRLGTRLYVRGATRRFLQPLVRELTNWLSKTRKQSVELLRTAIVYCEESLTQDLHSLVPALCGALKVLEAEHEHDVAKELLYCCSLLGRFIAPDSHIPFLLPRLRGEKEVLPGGTDAESRALVLRVGAAMISGSLPSEILPHLQELVEALTDEAVVLQAQAPALRQSALASLRVVLEGVGSGRAAVAAHFLSTGRLASKDRLFLLAARALLVWHRDPALRNEAARALHVLAAMDDDSTGVREQQPAATEAAAEADGWPTRAFLARYAGDLARHSAGGYAVDALWDDAQPAHLVFTALLELTPLAELELASAEAAALTSAEAADGTGPARVDGTASRVQALHAVLGETDQLLERALPGLADELDAAQQTSFLCEWTKAVNGLLVRLEALPSTAARTVALPGPVVRLLLAVVARLSGHLLAAGPPSDEPGAVALGQAHLSMLSLTLRLGVTGTKSPPPALSWTLLAPHAELLVAALVSHLDRPGQPAEQRAAALEALGHVLLVGRGIPRLKSFAAMGGAERSSACALAPSRLAMPAVLRRLDDANADVRAAAVATLEELLFFVAPPPPGAAVDEVPPGWLSLRALLVAVLPHVTPTAEADGAFGDLVENLLRQAAVVAPHVFLDEVRAINAQPGCRCQRTEDLIDHGELILSLAK